MKPRICESTIAQGLAVRGQLISNAIELLVHPLRSDAVVDSLVYRVDMFLEGLPGLPPGKRSIQCGNYLLGRVHVSANPNAWPSGS